MIFVIGLEAEHLREIFHVDGSALRSAVKTLHGERIAFHGVGIGREAANISDVDQFCVRNLNATARSKPVSAYQTAGAGVGTSGKLKCKASLLVLSSPGALATA